ncbi:ABC transporter G family member 22 [Camellia lanceoleosa]|uniref:ABC transporter G family member 22 n=1 Tax=Camellia lanceoleosa TaxID=1840588 RepID=A0ACC0I2T7_9ERIC|nr:ABC transporter G family member 22 [Camellia lanceoleosa]
MGPSGSGKTTLLSLLVGRVRGSTPGGSITYNDQPYLKFLKSSEGNIDICSTPMTSKDIDKTRKGKTSHRPLLFGEFQEREEACQIGNEIIINHSLLFLDEPTSLDSTTALRIIQILQDIAEGGNDFEIYDSERTVGHTGQLYILASYCIIKYHGFFYFHGV